MAEVRLNWRGDAVKAEYRRRTQRLIKLITIDTHNQIKKSINRQGPTKTNPTASPSRPGEPPKKRTGRLISSIGFRLKKNIGIVGSSVVYSKFLELGTSKMAARPFFQPALKNIEKRFRQYVRRVRVR